MRVRCKKSWDNLKSKYYDRAVDLHFMNISVCKILSLGTLLFVYRMFLRNTFTAQQQIEERQSFDKKKTKKKKHWHHQQNSDVLTVTVTAFFRVSTFKNLLSISDVESKEKLWCFSYCLTKFKYYIQNRFSWLPTTKYLKLCQHIFEFAWKKIPTSLLHFRTTAETNSSTKQSVLNYHPCSSLASHSWSYILVLSFFFFLATVVSSPR